ncbi:unnamed protein product [Calypogeia fissa]
MASTVAKQQLQRRIAAVLQVVQQQVRLSGTCRSGDGGNSRSLRSSWTSRRHNSGSSSDSSSSAAQQPGAVAEGGAAAEGGAKLATPETAVPPPNARTIRGGPVSWLSLGLLVTTGVGLLTYYDGEKKRRIEVLKQRTATPTAGPSVGKAAIGGPFKLLNHEGKEVTERDFKGNWTVVYFGFTFCPDICPQELTKLAKAVDNVEKQIGLKIVPVFISVDPERDTVEQVRDYLKDYHPRLVGLTGSVDDIRQAARQYRVYYMKTDEDGSNYLVDHSIIMYLMDPNMEFVKFYGKNYDADTLTAGIIEEIQKVSKQ